MDSRQALIESVIRSYLTWVGAADSPLVTADLAQEIVEALEGRKYYSRGQLEQIRDAVYPGTTDSGVKEEHIKLIVAILTVNDLIAARSSR